MSVETSYPLPAEFRLIRILAQSPLRVIYQAEDPGSRPIAVTVPSAEVLGDPARRMRLARETVVAVALCHPHVWPARPYEIDDRLYLIGPFVAGADLDAALAVGTPLPVARIIRILGQVAGALDAAHRVGLVHGNVEPDAIALDPRSDDAYLRDFGLGTDGPADARTDAFALGCLLYRCLTGRRPFPQQDPAATVDAEQTTEVTIPISRCRSDLPPAIDHVIGRALAPDPAVRFATCRGLIDAAAAALGVAAAPTRARTGTPRQRWMIAVAAVVLLVAGFLVVPRIVAGLGPRSADLARVPAALRAGCEYTGTDPALPHATELLRCRDGSGQNALIGLFAADTTADTDYRAMVTAAAGIRTGVGDCADGPGFEHSYPGVGSSAGRVFCVRDGSTARLAWIDRATHAVAVELRTDGNSLELYRSWARWVAIPAFPTPAEQQLLDLIREHDCRRAKAGTLDGLDGVESAIDCVPPGNGATTFSYYRFADADGLRRSYQADAAGVAEGPDCLDPAKPPGVAGNATYNVSLHKVGTLLCRTVDGAQPSLTWTIDVLRILGRASGTRSETLLSWWRDAEPPPARAIVDAVNRQAQPAFPNAQEAALIERIPAASRVNCQRPDADAVRAHSGGAKVIGVQCGTNRLPLAVFYYQFEDRGLVAKNYVVAPGAPDCTTLPAQFRGEARYTRPDGATGSLYCAMSPIGKPSLSWSDERYGIYGLAFVIGDSTPADLIAWWRADAGPS